MKKVPVYPGNLNLGPIIPASGITVASPAVVMPIAQPVLVMAQPVAANVPIVAPAAEAMDPASRKGGVVVAQPASNPTL